MPPGFLSEGGAWGWLASLIREPTSWVDCVLSIADGAGDPRARERSEAFPAVDGGIAWDSRVGPAKEIAGLRLGGSSLSDWVSELPFSAF